MAQSNTKERKNPTTQKVTERDDSDLKYPLQQPCWLALRNLAGNTCNCNLLASARIYHSAEIERASSSASWATSCTLESEMWNCEWCQHAFRIACFSLKHGVEWWKAEQFNISLSTQCNLTNAYYRVELFSLDYLHVGESCNWSEQYWEDNQIPYHVHCEFRCTKQKWSYEVCAAAEGIEFSQHNYGLWHYAFLA